MRDILLDNTRASPRGLPANNALLWGARGMGKSSLVKAVHAAVNARAARRARAGRDPPRGHPHPAAAAAPICAAARGAASCSATTSPSTASDTSYKSLKAVLEGGIEGRPDNVVFYATSNRRHLMPRDMIENERSTAINPAEAVEEKVSLSDRFGLWLGFHACDQDTYFAMIEGYARHFGLDLPNEELRAEAIEWSVTRGARSGRVAWQFIQDLAGRLGKPLELIGPAISGGSPSAKKRKGSPACPANDKAGASLTRIWTYIRHGDRVMLVQPVEPHSRIDQARDDIAERVNPAMGRGML